MLIKKMALNNFRQYIGQQVIEFSTDKQQNVTVLIGMNTSGKTTFIRAFEWILYNTKTDFKDPVLLNVNVVEGMQLGEVQTVTGSLFIEHNGTEYEITRKQHYTCTGKGQVRTGGTSATIAYLQADGQTKTEISSTFESNIEKILPRALSPYFFFGGERVGAISNREDIEASVQGLMGLDVLQNAMRHLKLVINKLKRGMDYSGDQGTRDAQAKLESTIIRKEECEKELEEIIGELEYYQAEKEKYAILLKANEETANKQKKREQLEVVIKKIESRIERETKAMVATFSQNGFAFFGMPLLKRAIDMLDSVSEDTESVPEMSGPAIDYILKRGQCICGTCISPGSMAEKCILAEKAKMPPESIGTVVHRYREQAMEYLSASDTYPQEVEEKFKTIRESKRELAFRCDELSELANSLKNAKSSVTLEKQYQEAENKCREFARKVNDLTEKIGGYKKDIANCEKTLETRLATNAKNLKVKAYIAYATEALDWVSEAYKSKEDGVREKLEEKVNANFKKMYHGTRTVTIDPKYRVKYVDVTTEESEGLKAVKSFAFVAGLVDLAKEALDSEKMREANVGPQYYPLVMDAPFSNMDELHIKNISKVLPVAAEQVIIAVMQKDWEPAEETMTPFVGKSYHIVKDVDAFGKPIDTMTHIK